jgi:type IV secretory pathway VirB10-like protein
MAESQTETPTENLELEELRRLSRVSSADTQKIRAELSRIFGATQELAEELATAPPEPMLPPPLVVAPPVAPPPLPKPPGRPRVQKRVREPPKEDAAPEPSPRESEEEPSWLAQAAALTSVDDAPPRSSASDLSHSPTELRTDDLSELSRAVEALSQKLEALERMVRTAPRRSRSLLLGAKRKKAEAVLTPMELERQRGLRR